MKKYELLLPAGNLEKLKWALAYGADAVYAGVPASSLRARENQFTWESLAEGVRLCREQGKKIYFTANVYAHNVKIKPFLAAFEKMQAMAPDAYIMSDPGLIDLVRQKWPTAVIHLSVQANNTNWAQVQFWQKQGITRVILSRELSLREVKEIHEMCPTMELEFFVHGSICMAYSGRCLLSNYFSKRDPNQGTCSHSCRWEYKVYKKDALPEGLYDSTGRPEDYQELRGEFYLEEETRRGEMLPVDEDEWGTYIMNARDLCALGYLQDLAAAGVCSFKVEGRSKTINYLAGVGRAYRPAVDALEQGTSYKVEELASEIFAISNRGYTPGFLVGDPGAEAICFNKDDQQHRHGFAEESFLGIVESYDPATKYATIAVRNRFLVGESVRLINPSSSHTFVVSSIVSLRGEPLEAAHGGAGSFRVLVPVDPGKYALLRGKATPNTAVDTTPVALD